MTLIRILAQYEENYGYSEGNQAWKPKGGQEFEVEIPIDFMMFCKEHVEEVIKEFLANESNEACRYSLLDFEPIFTKPRKWSNEAFLLRVQETNHAAISKAIKQ